ncbi:MAG: hypothetical protein NVS1B3_17240 [Candidatus Dormibacteraceae bacterium]
MMNRATFLKGHAFPALYLAVPLYLGMLVGTALERHFYDRPPDLFWRIADALSWFFAPSILLTLMIGGNAHDLNPVLLYAFSFAQTYLAVLIAVVIAKAIRRASGRGAAKPAG